VVTIRCVCVGAKGNPAMLSTMRTGRPLKHDEKTRLRTLCVPESLDKRIQDKADKDDKSWSETAINALRKIFK